MQELWHPSKYCGRYFIPQPCPTYAVSTPVVVSHTCATPGGEMGCLSTEGMFVAAVPAVTAVLDTGERGVSLRDFASLVSRRPWLRTLKRSDPLLSSQLVYTPPPFALCTVYRYQLTSSLLSTATQQQRCLKSRRSTRALLLGDNPRTFAGKKKAVDSHTSRAVSIAHFIVAQIREGSLPAGAGACSAVDDQCWG